MAVNGYRVFDGDLHLHEPADLWQRYIDPEHRDRAPVGTETTTAFTDGLLWVDGKIVNASGEPDKVWRQDIQAEWSKRAGRLEQYMDFERRGWGPDTQIEAMDTEGVDLAVLYPTRGLSANGVEYDDDGLAAAVSRAYNDWLGDFCSYAPERLFGAAMVTPQNIEAAAQEARRTKREYGFKAIYIRPNPVGGRNWHDPAYDPLWAACEEEDMLVGFHNALSCRLPQAIAERFSVTEDDSWLTSHVICHPAEMMYAMLSMISCGVLERFPRLRVAFLEANCGWVPYLLWRMDEHYEMREILVPEIKQKLPLEPGEYFRRQCFVCIEADESVSCDVVERIADNVVFSTDYPHPDSAYPNAVKTFLDLPMSEDLKHRILWQNCLRMYNMQR